MARKPYWIGIGFLIVVQVVATNAAPEDSGWALLSDFDDILVAALVGRRMRDFGWSPFWAWLGVAFIQMAIPLAFIMEAKQSETNLAFFPDIPPAAQNLTAVLFYILIGFAGFVRGDPGPNRFGPAPSEGAPALKPQAEADDPGAGDVDAIIARALAARGAAAKTATSPGAAIAAEARNPSRSAPPVFGKRR
ncbi:DUF805 domain-containing protein [Methylocapsa sp. S129]|uniref:DUF805 domain-containing protein n=1 Tax=Methylocapsa sp. S129 TaxID=1641869 RepID=UPI00131C9E17|nr:DUF805 domain-containing protein [Methylocapsa sp. S129]